MNGMMSGVKLKTLTPSYLPCVLSGLLLGLSCPSYPYVRLEILAWVWMVPLLLSLREVQSFPRFILRFYLAAFVTCVTGMSWLLTATPRGALILFFFGALVFTAPAAPFYFIRRTFGWRTALWSAPIVWTAWDWIYHRSEGSFGWLPMGVTQSNLNWLVQYVDVTGVWGVTFWLVLFNVLVVMTFEDWHAKRDRSRRNDWTPLVLRLAIVCVPMLGIPLAYSVYVFTRPSAAARRELSVMLVQPNVNPWDKLAEESRAGVLRKTIGLTNTALRGTTEKPDLIIWPETAVPYSLAANVEARQAVYRGVTRWEIPLLTGMFDVTSDEGDPARTIQGAEKVNIYNAATVVSTVPDATGRRLKVKVAPAHHKQELVPFVERVPYSDRLPILKNLAINVGAGDGTRAGSDATVLSFHLQRGAEIKVGAAICYESLYPAAVAEFVRGGAQMLAVVSNDGWFSRTHGEYQMAAFSRLRSIETRRATARTANTGITELIDRYGRVYAAVPWWSEQTLTGHLTLSDELSFYVRYTDYLPRGCAWISLVLLLAAAAVRARAAVRSFHPSVYQPDVWTRRRFS